MNSRTSGVTHSQHDEELATTIVTAVADARGVDPLDLPPLYDEVDLDAIDRLFQSNDRDAELSVSVEVAGCEVTIREGPTVTAHRLTPVDADGESRTALK